MSDRKYDDSNDRQLTDLDFRQRVIDLMANRLEVPNVGIYDEPVRYFKANKQWCKIIFGWLDWLEEIAGWPDSEDELHPGIQAILTFEEGIEPPMADPINTYEAIKMGIYDAMNDLAKQIVSGRTVNISVGEDGTVSDPTTDPTGGASLPEDDPLTAIDETEAAKMGAIIAQTRAIEKFLDRCDTFYGATNGTPVTTIATAQQQIRLLFKCDEAKIDAAMSEYYAYRATENRILYDTSESHQLYMFCRGGGEFAWNNLLIELSGFNAYKIATVSGLTDALADEFWTDAYAAGAAIPSTNYLDASCIPVEPQSFTAVPFASMRSTTMMKANHRIKLKFTGLSTDTDGDTQDAFWYTNATTGVRTRSNPTFGYLGGAGLPSDNEVVYNAAHIYEFTVDLPNIADNLDITFVKNGGMSASASVPNFTIDVVDLGEYA